MTAGSTWAASNTGWSNDYLGLMWLRDVFIPSTTPRPRPRATTMGMSATISPLPPRPRRLLIVDGHGSHVRSTFIGLCIENDIDLMILPAHTSHKTQPLDFGIFGPLKRAMTRETDRVATYSKGTIHKAIYTSLLIAARSQAMTADNIKSGWRGTGLWPLRPSLLIRDLEEPTTPTLTSPKVARTPLGSLMTENRDFIRQHADTLRTPAKRHFTSLSDRLEAALAKIALLEREMAARDELDRVKRPRKGMTVSNVGQHHFSTPHVLQQAVQIETEGIARKHRQAASQPSRMIQDASDGSPRLRPSLMEL